MSNMNVKIRTIKSDLLKRSMNISIYTPENYENTKLPILYFFHGRTGNENILVYLKMNEIADKLIKNNVINPFIIVCPYIGNSRGVNSSGVYREIQGKYSLVHKGLFEDYFIKEVIPFVESYNNVIPSKDFRYIGGISMGGYVSLHIGLNHQNLFSKIGAHMPAMDLSYEDEDEYYFESKEMWEKYDPVTICENKDINGLKVFLDCGEKDEGKFYLSCEKLYKLMKSKNIDVENHIFNGNHSDKYIMSNLEKYYKFYSGTPKKSA